MKNISPKKNIILLSSEEEKLLKKYIEEYNELYQKILILSPNDFIQTLSKRVKIVLKEKINGFSSSNITKVENFILEKIYANDYKHSLFAKRSILQRDQNELNNHYFTGDIIPHCDNDKKDGYYIHSCGNKFQIFKYKNNINFDNLNRKNQEEKNDNNNILLLYCEECDMIYKSNLIKFCCFSTGEDFYSKVTDSTNSDNCHLATWKKYHCNIIINDVMKCQTCHENLYYLPNVNHLFCKKCNHEFETNLYTWKCIKCKKDFIAEVKIYNPFEYKNMKISIKEAILNKKRARPDYLGCGCEINNDPKKLKFYHKSSCTGDLYLGELNKKKIVVCSKCESMGSYEGYVWTCPICTKRFKTDMNYINDNCDEKENINNNNNNGNIKNIITSKYMNYSNSNYNINVSNISNIYKSPIKFKNNNCNLYVIPNNNLINKCKSDTKNIGLLRRNNSAIKLIDNNKLDFLGQSNNINVYKNNNKMVNIKRVCIPKSKNYSPNCSPYKNQSKLEQRYVNNNNQDISNNKRANRLMSNLDLTDTKNFQNIYSKFFNGEKINQISFADYNYNNNIYKIEQKDNIKADLFGTKNLNQPLYNKIFNNNIIGKKRAYSNCNSININLDDGMPFTKISPKNNKIINNNKIPINKINNIQPKIINYSAYESTSGDSQGEKSPKDNTSKNNQNKKVIPGQLNLINYIIKKQIGKGSYGQIFLVEDVHCNQYALKKIIASSESMIKKIKNELKILLDIQNSFSQLNVVSIYGITSQQLDITTHALYVLMELATSDWEKEILERKKLKQYYSEYELMSILFSLVKSLSILQQKNISHRDIKPQNILIFKDKKTGTKKYKLADFGEAKELMGENSTDKQTLRGTELYMAPILFYALRARKKMKYVQHNTYKSDVFSFGLCSLFAATLGFNSLYDVRELKNNISIFVVVEKYLRFKYSDSVVNIISKMLDLNENSRCDFITLEKEFNNIGYY